MIFRPLILFFGIGIASAIAHLFPTISLQTPLSMPPTRLRCFLQSLAICSTLIAWDTFAAAPPQATEEASGPGPVTDSAKAAPLEKGGVLTKPPLPPPTSAPTDPEAATDTTITVSPNAAGFALYRALTATPQWMPNDGNLVLSPANLEPILLALEAGASGESAAQLAAILRPENDSPATPVPLETSDGNPPENGATSASVWVEQKWKVKTSYTDTLKQSLGMAVQAASFAEKAPEEAAAINRWVSEATHDRIPQLFDPSELKPDTKMVLASALVYDGAWVDPFDATQTQPGPFRFGARKRESMQTAMMHRRAEFACAESPDGIKVVSLPLEKGAHRCVLFLPKESANPLDGLRALEKTLTVSRYRELTEPLTDRSLDLRLPRLKVDVRSSIKAGLQMLGAGSLFDPKEADLSRISDERDLCVSILRHQVSVEWDEKGARGAASTGATIVSRGWPGKPQTWTFDRPFLFVIEAVDTGEILFLGRLVKPIESISAAN